MSPFDVDLPPDLDEDERAALVRLAERLESERPVIRASTRGDIRRGLSSLPARRRPRHLRPLVAGFACAGAVCLALASLGLTNSTPDTSAKADTGSSLTASR
jgi:hypothetical protein